MHIPDGLMDPLVALLGWAEYLVVAAVAVYLAGRATREKDLPRIAVLSAGIFVAQMLNFPIGGGTTGHLIGGALFAIMAGPVVAIVGMSVILLIQALMFGDGGLTAFGLNALNMAIIAPLIGWGTYSLLKPFIRGNAREGVAIGAAAWASTFVAAAACAAELAVSHAISDGAYGIAATVSIPAMLGYHAVIGVGEGVITAGVLSYVRAVAPETLTARPAPPRSHGLRALFSSRISQASVAILIVFALALPLYFIYSSEGSDGLEQTMSDAGVEEDEPFLASPFSYGETYFAALFAGILGFLAVTLAALGMLVLIRGRNALD